MKDNKLGIMPISKLIWNMSLPIIVSMLVQALYNIVDSVFVSQVSEQALTAVTLAFPAQNLMIGLATGTAVGVNALLGRALGAPPAAAAHPPYPLTDFAKTRRRRRNRLRRRRVCLRTVTAGSFRRPTPPRRLCA